MKSIAWPYDGHFRVKQTKQKRDVWKKKKKEKQLRIKEKENWNGLKDRRVHHDFRYDKYERA